MDITFHLSWWHIPTLITVVSFICAIYLTEDTGGMFGGINVLFSLIPASLISMISWIIGGICK